MSSDQMIVAVVVGPIAAAYLALVGIALTQIARSRTGVWWFGWAWLAVIVAAPLVGIVAWFALGDRTRCAVQGIRAGLPGASTG